MVRVYNVNRFSPNTNDIRVTYELFADTKAEVVPGVKVEGLDGNIPVGTKVYTAAGEVARMTSSGNWVWSANSGSKGKFVVNLHGDNTTSGYPVADCTYDDILAAIDEGLNIVANVTIDYTGISGHHGEKVSFSNLQLSCRETYEPGSDDSREASDALIFTTVSPVDSSVVSLVLPSVAVWQDTQKALGILMLAMDRRLPIVTDNDRGKILSVNIEGHYYLKEQS